MGVDVLILNTGVVDLRREGFEFVDELVGRGGLAKCKSSDMPAYSQEQLAEWIEGGSATAGGPGNTAPLISKAGLKVAVGVNLGKGDFDGLDAQGRFFYDVMTGGGVDMSQSYIHPDLHTGTVYIHSGCGEERSGIVYFAGANDDFDFEIFKGAVERLKPTIVYYMYSGLSERGDANGGRDLSEFIKWCRGKNAITIVDSHTLTSDPAELIDSGKPIAEYKLLEPLLPEVDLFFTSCDEARMIENTLGTGRRSNEGFLDFLSERFWRKENRTRVFGVTVGNGAFEKHIRPDGTVSEANTIESAFMGGEVVDLVGAGDSFRAGLITYIGRNLDEFKDGSINFAEAVQMGNLFAAVYIKAPLDDRCSGIKGYEEMLRIVRSSTS